MWRCAFCDEPAQRLAKLEPSQQEEVAEYFQSEEQRPYASDRVLICGSCKRVQDDCILSKTAFGINMKCKRCHRAIYLTESMSCTACDTAYKWQVFPEYGGYEYLAICSDEERARMKAEAEIEAWSTDAKLTTLGEEVGTHVGRIGLQVTVGVFPVIHANSSSLDDNKCQCSERRSKKGD